MIAPHVDVTGIDSLMALWQQGQSVTKELEDNMKQPPERNLGKLEVYFLQLKTHMLVIS